MPKRDVEKENTHVVINREDGFNYLENPEQHVLAKILDKIIFEEVTETCLSSENISLQDEGDCKEVSRLRIEDITKEEWEKLDRTLEEYDRNKLPYPEDEIPLLKFIYTLIGEDIRNFIKVPEFIRMGKTFMAGALKYNGRVYQFMS